MTISQAKLTLKRAPSCFKRSFARIRKPIIHLLQNSQTTSSTGASAEGETPTTSSAGATTEEIRKLSLAASTGEGVIYAFGVLGIVGPLDNFNSGGMVTDFAAWLFMIANMKGFGRDRAVWQTIRPIHHLFPDGYFTLGEAGCDRLQLLLPTLDTNSDAQVSAHSFASQCLMCLCRMAQKVKRGEKLVLLLIGHSVLYDGVFQFLFTTNPHQVVAEAFLTKRDLEVALEGCQGDILVISNSCHSGHLASEQWTILCPACPHQESVPAQSSSEYFRGSMFTACMLAQVVHGQGLRVPSPRAEQGADHVLLPRLQHSFSTPAAAQLSIMKPLNVSLETLMDRIGDMQHFLRANSQTMFEVKGSHSRLNLTNVFPVEFTAEIVVQTKVKPTSADDSARYNAAIPVSDVGSNSNSRPAPTSLNPQFKLSSSLSKLLAAQPDIRPIPFRWDYACWKTIVDLRRHLTLPEQYGFPPNAVKIGENNLLFMLRSVHFQAIAVQLIAREMRWCDVAKVTAFLPYQGNGSAFQEMIEKGVRVDLLANHLAMYYFKGYIFKASMDLNSARWLSVKWNAAGRPLMMGSEWDELIKSVAVMTEREAILD